MDNRHEVREFLMSRRAKVTPEQAGLPAGTGRRVPGLRRSEVAMLAGVSVDYYARLEQGRERHPSAQVLTAIGEVLRLDDDARTHLFRVAGLSPLRHMDAAAERVAPELQRLLDLWSQTPAIVLGRALDVLGGNALGYALFEGFPQGENLLATLFLDPRARRFYDDWAGIAEYTVAGLRMQHGAAPDDPRMRDVLGSLLESSTDFAELWARHDARSSRLTTKTLHHRDVGALTLQVNTFDVKAAPGQELVVYHAAPESPSAAAIERLASLYAAPRE